MLLLCVASPDHGSFTTPHTHCITHQAYHMTMHCQAPVRCHALQARDEANRCVAAHTFCKLVQGRVPVLRLRFVCSQYLLKLQVKAQIELDVHNRQITQGGHVLRVLTIGPALECALVHARSRTYKSTALSSAMLDV